MFDWLTNAYNDLIQWFKDIFQDVVDFFTELPIKVLDGILDGIASIIASIPVPQFITDGLNTLLTSVDPAVLYFLDRSGFQEAMAILGVGVTFRLTRKLMTLGNW